MSKCEKDCNTPKVLEIHNHECPVLFHRVMVPAAMGDDETNPPRNGQYRNVLLVYEANDHVYLFSSDGIPTFISDGGQGVDDYNELENKPSINGHELIGDSSLEDIGVTDAIDDALDDYTPTADLSAVALSGDYDDLINKPTIPTVNDAILTIQKEGSSIGTFTANSATNTTINVVETDPTVPSWAKQPTKPTYSYSEITNKPTIPTKTSDLTNDGSDGTSTYVESDDLATVATSGSYNDLSNKPTIPAAQVNSDWNASSGVAQILNKPNLATVATTGSYNDLTDKPANFELVEMSYGESNAWAKFIAAYQGHKIVYCRASSNTNPATGTQGRKAFMAVVDNAENPTYVEFQYVRSVATKTAAQPVDQVFVYELKPRNGGTWNVTTRNMAPKLAQGTNTTVSYSNGTYTISATGETYTAGSNISISNQNVISAIVPTKTSDLTNDGSDGSSTYVEATDLATVATTGAYSDLTGTPTIPTVNDATLTIQRNGTNVETFTANSSTNKTANIVVPTLTSDLTNDSGFITDTDYASASTGGVVKVGAGLSITNGVLSVTGGGVADAVEWTNVLNRPSTVSYWTNDAGYITSADLPTKTSDLTNDGSDGTSTYVEADDLATVATSGSYNDLTNKPTIPTVNDATITIQRNSTNVDSFTVNASQNKSINIVVPTKTSDLTNDSNFATTSQIPTKTSDLTNDGSEGTSTYVEADDLAAVATSGSYTDLSNRPTIGNATLTIQKNGTNVQTFTANATSNKTANITVPTKTSDLTNDSNFVSNTDYATASTGGVVKVGSGLEITNGVLSATGGGTADAVEWDNVLNKPTFSTVATSGSYNDLTDKPTIPTVNNATLTIQKNNTNVATFTANASSNVTANISVPTATSDLTNDSGFITSITKITNAEIDAIMGVA